MIRPRRASAAVIAALVVLGGAATVPAGPAGAATPSWLHVHTVYHATAYNGGRAKISPAVGVSGRRIITGTHIAAFQHGKRIRQGSYIRLKPGKYRTVTSGTYKTYTVSTVTRTRQVLHGGGVAAADCTVTSVSDDGMNNGTVDSEADCVDSFYPGQHQTDDELDNTNQVGDTYQADVYFDDEYVAQQYTATVRHYSANHKFRTPKRALTVRKGGLRHEFVGSGVEDTSTFRAPSSWKVSYTWNCSSFGESGNMIIEVDRSNGDYETLAANRLAFSGRGTSHVHASGRFYLSINSECDWDVVVAQ